MIWTREDEMALASCLKVKRTAVRYGGIPVPVYRTLPRLYAALLEAGLIQREPEEPADVCRGCVNYVGGTCRKEYREAEMDYLDTKIVRCRFRREKMNPFPTPPTVRADPDAGSLCHGCVEQINGTSCRNGYSGATLDESRTKVVECRLRRDNPSVACGDSSLYTREP